MSIFSDIKVFKVNSTKADSKLLARGSVVVHNTVRFNFTVLKGSNGRFVSLPSEKGKQPDENGNTKYYPIVSLASRELSDELNRLVLEVLDKEGGSSTTSSSSASAGKSKGVQTKLPF